MHKLYASLSNNASKTTKADHFKMFTPRCKSILNVYNFSLSTLYICMIEDANYSIQFSRTSKYQQIKYQIKNIGSAIFATRVDKLSRIRFVSFIHLLALKRAGFLYEG